MKSSSDIDVLLSAVNTALRVPLTPADILGTFPGGSDLADPTRRHRIWLSGTMVSVVGGTTTTTGAGPETVDAAIAVGKLTAAPCITETTPLIGARIHPTASLPDFAVARYGSKPRRLRSCQGRRPVRPRPPGIDVTRAEIRFAVRHGAPLRRRRPRPPPASAWSPPTPTGQTHRHRHRHRNPRRSVHMVAAGHGRTPDDQAKWFATIRGSDRHALVGCVEAAQQYLFSSPWCGG